MDEVGGDWLASLARQCTSADRKSSSNPSGSVGSAKINNNNSNNVLTKAQRIERRNQKRSQREERKRSAEEARQQRIARKRQYTKHGSDSKIVRAKSSSEGGNRATPKSGGVITSTTKQAQSRLSASLESTLSSHEVHQKSNISLLSKICPRKDNNKHSSSTSLSPQKIIPTTTIIINGLPAEPSGKATKRSTLRPDSKELQPRIRDYNGQGLVRPSLYLPFNDPSFVPKLELEFHEHVPGFFGKAKKKASKKDEDMMLWKKCLKAKVTGAGGGTKEQDKGTGNHMSNGIATYEQCLEMRRLTPITIAVPIIPPFSREQEKYREPLQKDAGNSIPHFRNRMFVCLLAIAANWVTTLSIAKNFSTRAIDVPSFDFATSTCKAAYNITKDERTSHSSCVETQLNQCNIKLDQTTKKEDKRVKKLSKYNEDVVRRIEEVATNCSNSYTTLRLALEDWTANGGEIPLRMESTTTESTDLMCTAEDQALFNQTMLGTQNTLALQTEALQMATAYSDESTMTVTRLASTVTDLDNDRSSLTDYIEDRVKYDIDYLDRKMQNIRDGVYGVVKSLDPALIPPVDLDEIFQDVGISAKDVMSCVSLDVNARMVNGSICQPNMAKMVDDFVVDAKWKVAFLTQKLYDYRDKVNEYKQNVADTFVVTKRFYDGATAFINVARKIIFWEDMGDWFDISVSDLIPRNVNFPDVDVAVGSIGSFGSINLMWQKILPKIDAYYSSLGVVKTRIKTRITGMFEDVMMDHSVSVYGLLPQIRPNDYNPPNFSGVDHLGINPDEELALYKNKTELFKTSTRAALGMFSGIGNQYNGDILDSFLPTFNITEIKNKVTNIDLSFEGFQRPDIDFDLWFLEFLNFSGLFIYVDYTYRLYITVRLLMKYWFATSLAMPIIDLRTNKEMKNPFRMHPVRVILSFLTSPIGGLIVFLLACVWLLVLAVALYTPLLQSYTSGCVSADGNGTFITKNMYSIAYNFAYQDGSALLVEGMDTFDLKRSDTCSSRYTSSATLQNTMASNVTAYSNFHRQMSRNMHVAQRCIDSDALDSAFTEACCNMLTYPDCINGNSHVTCPMDDRRAIMTIPIPYELPGISLADASCSINTSNESDWSIKTAVFDCEQLDTCSVTCPGPHKSLLNAISQRCGCTLEWYGHSKLMQSIFAFFVFVFMNIARMTFFSGLTRLLWKQIYPGRFTVSATCDSDGAIVTSLNARGSTHKDFIIAIQAKTKGTDDNELSKEFHSKLHRCLRNFYTTGVVLLLVSVLANGVWIYALLVTSQSLIPYVWRNDVN